MVKQFNKRNGFYTFQKHVHYEKLTIISHEVRELKNLSHTNMYLISFGKMSKIRKGREGNNREQPKALSP